MDKPKKVTDIDQDSAKQYLKKVFPIETGECEVEYCSVGINRYRINFYTDKTPKSFMRDLYVSRSYYVILKEDGETWSHEII